MKSHEEVKREKFDRLLTLYCDLDKWARGHDIKLFLDWGTLLGAVRHRGFIPWDFDLDVTACWDDYQKMLSCWKEDPIPGHEIVNIDRYPDYPAAFSRFVELDSTEIRRASAWGLAPCGMSIDVFPLIPLPKDEKKKKRARDAFIVWYEMKVDLKLTRRSRTADVRKLYKKMWRMSKVIGRKRVLSRLEKDIFFFPEEECSEYQLMSAGTRESVVIDKKLLGELKELPFCGHMAYVPEHYIEYLESIFGPDWRMYPNKRSENYTYVENLNVPYDVYVDDYMQFLDKEEVISTLKYVNGLEMRDMIVRNEISPVYYRIAAEPLVMRIEAHELPAEASALKNEVADELMRYVHLQLSEKYKYWSVWGGLNDEWLAIACELLFSRGEYDRAVKLIELRESSVATPLTKGVLSVYTRIKKLLSLLNAIDYGDKSRAAQLIEEGGQGIFDERVRAIATLFEAFPPDKNGFSEFFSAALEAGTSWPEDWYIKRFLAYAYAIAGNQDERARECYRDIEEHCNNGMVVLHAMDDRKELGLV